MAVYVYDCPRCGQIEHEQSIHEPLIDNCPKCGTPAKRIVGIGTFIGALPSYMSDANISANARHAAYLNTPEAKAKDLEWDPND